MNEDSESRPSFDGVGYAAAFVACFVLAAQNSMARYCVARGLTPDDLVAIRFCLPGLLWLPFFVKRLRQNDGRQWAMRGLVVAISAGVPYGLLVTNGYRFASASHGSVIVPSATLVGGLLLSRVVLGTAIRRAAVVSAGVALVGITLVSGIGVEDQLGEPRSLNETHARWVGDVLFVAAGLVWACHPVTVQKLSLTPRDVVPCVMTWSLLYLPWYLAASFMNDTNLPTSLARPDGPSWGLLAWAVIFYTGLHSSMAIPLYAFATRRLSALRIALLTPLIPIIGVLVAVVCLGERLSGQEIIGGVLVVIALGVSVKTK